MVVEKEYHIDFNDPVEAARTSINIFRDQLIEYRGKSAKGPDELEWEIRLYDFMLKDPAVRLAAYQEGRQTGHGRTPVAKRIVVQRLGWKIP